MTRKKVKLAYITNDSARKATFKKRKKGLLKKVSELSTLCGVDACAIIYSPYDSQPEVWPPSPTTVRGVLAKFKDMPEMEQSKKMVNQESFLKQRLAKAKDQLKKLHKDNREKEIACLMYRTLTLTTSRGGSCGLLQGLGIVDLNDLSWLIDRNLKDIHHRMEEESLKEKENHRNLFMKDIDHHHYMTTRIDHLKENDNNNNTIKTNSHYFNNYNTNNDHWQHQQLQGTGGGPLLKHSPTTSTNAAMVAQLRVEEKEDVKHKAPLGLGGSSMPQENFIGASGAGSSSSYGVETTKNVVGAAGAGSFSSYGVEAPMQNKHQWLMDLLSNDHLEFGGGDDMLLPFGDPYAHSALWSSAFFP